MHACQMGYASGMCPIHVAQCLSRHVLKRGMYQGCLSMNSVQRIRCMHCQHGHIGHIFQSTHPSIHTGIHTYIHAYRQTGIHAYPNTNIHTYTHSHTHTDRHIYVPADLYKGIHTGIYTPGDRQTGRQAHIHTCRGIYTNTLVQRLACKYWGQCPAALDACAVAAILGHRYIDMP